MILEVSRAKRVKIVVSLDETEIFTSFLYRVFWNPDNEQKIPKHAVAVDDDA